MPLSRQCPLLPGWLRPCLLRYGLVAILAVCRAINAPYALHLFVAELGDVSIVRSYLSCFKTAI